MKDQVLNREKSVERSTLIEGLHNKGGFNNDREFMAFMRSIFDKYNNAEVIKIFKKWGDATDIQFLVDKAKSADPKLVKVIIKTLGKRWPK